MEEEPNFCTILVGNPGEGNGLEDLKIDEKILNWILRK
jgi:hypothetical protein